MRPIEALLFCALALTLLAAAVPRLRATRWIGWLAPASLLIASVQAIAEGARWQMFPAYALSLIFFLIWLAGLCRRGPRSGLASRVGLVLGLLTLALAAAPPLVFPIFRLPQPGGPYSIGTLTYHWIDPARAERFTADPGDRREMMVQIWYPASATRNAPRTLYVGDGGVFAALAKLMHLPGFVFSHLDQVTTHAVEAAPVAEGNTRFPVLIFLHGRGGFRQHNSVQVEDLVSHGYVVAAIDQPYAATGVTFPDGRRVLMDPRMAERRYVDSMIPYLARDVSFALDGLTALDQADPNGLLTGRLDLRRTGVFGVSLGGMVALEACRVEPRLQACLAEDAPTPAEVVAAGLSRPVMWVTRDGSWMRREGWPQPEVDEIQGGMRSVYNRLPGPGYIVLVDGMFHVNYSDFPLMLAQPVSRRLGFVGPIDGRRGQDLVDAYSRAFFDRHIRNRLAPLLDAAAPPYPEVSFETRTPRHQ